MTRFVLAALAAILLSTSASAQFDGGGVWAGSSGGGGPPNVSAATGVLPIANGGTGATTLAGANIAVTTGHLGQFASTTSAQLATVLSDEEGSGGGFVRATSPTLTTPNIGAATGSSLMLTTPLAANDGGTGFDTFTVGDVLYASTTTALSRLASGTATHPLFGGGAGVAPSYRAIADADIPDTITASNYCALTGCTLTGALTVPAGSAAAPSIISTTGTSDTGLYFPGADQVALAAGGAKAFQAYNAGSYTEVGAFSSTQTYLISQLDADGASNLAGFQAQVRVGTNQPITTLRAFPDSNTDTYAGEAMSGGGAIWMFDFAGTASKLVIGAQDAIKIVVGTGTSTPYATWAATTGALTLHTNTTVGDAVIDNLTVAAAIQGTNALVFDGSSDDTVETIFAITNPTSSDKTITFPDASLTVNAAGDISGTTLASNVVTSSLTTVGALNAGSITSGFGAIDVGADTIAGGAFTGTTATWTSGSERLTPTTSLPTCNEAALGTVVAYEKGAGAVTSICVCEEVAGVDAWAAVTATGDCT